MRERLLDGIIENTICQEKFYKIEKNKNLNMENNNIKLGKYRHFKGKEYEVLGVAKHSESLEDFVVYKETQGERKIWIRPIESFLEEIEDDGGKMSRFLFIGK